MNSTSVKKKNNRINNQWKIGRSDFLLIVRVLIIVGILTLIFI